MGYVASGDPAARDVVSTALTQQGFSVHEINDPSMIVDFLTSSLPTLLVLDATTDGVDVPGICSYLRLMQGGTRVRVLVLTGEGDAEAVEAALLAGVSDFAARPFNARLLGQRIRHMLRSGALLDDLQRSEATLESAQRLVHLGNWTWDLGSGGMTWTGETYRLLGYPLDHGNPQFRDYLSRVHPEDADSLARSLEAALRGEQPLSVDHRVVHSDDTVLYLHSEAEIVLDAEGRPSRLSGTIQDITDRKKAESQIRFLAFYDSLTGLPNRLQFNEYLKTALDRGHDLHRSVAVMFLDLDNFKRINDTSGHSAGDLLLGAAATRLKDVVRASDIISRRGAFPEPEGTVARLGGDEFIVLLPDVAQAEDPAKVARRVLDAFREPFQVGSNEFFVSVSIGIGIFPQDGENAEDLLKNADAALYHAKDSGRNNFQFYSPALNDAAFRRLSLETSLRKAIERNEFILYYQPQVHARDGKLIGVEALIRWNHPDLGLVYPGQFVPLAEETGLIQAIDDWVLRQACIQSRAWLDAGLPQIHVAVNLSGSQFHRKDLLERVDAALGAVDLPAHCVELEITEGVLMSNAAGTLEVLQQLQARGFRIAVDDFGTGYSSLSYLRRFHADVLKIDRSFVHDIATNPDAAAIVSAIVTLAEALKMRAIAEGVEHPLQRECLYEHGCDLMQGYLFGKPVPPSEITSLLRAVAGHQTDTSSTEIEPATATPEKD
jgi:predicted signal transduction protein with EAL and GGDEF domain/DNA-binding response OmpR family regulator